MLLMFCSGSSDGFLWWPTKSGQGDVWEICNWLARIKTTSVRQMEKKKRAWQMHQNHGLMIITWTLGLHHPFSCIYLDMKWICRQNSSWIPNWYLWRVAQTIKTTPAVAFALWLGARPKSMRRPATLKAPATSSFVEARRSMRFFVGRLSTRGKATNRTDAAGAGGTFRFGHLSYNNWVEHVSIKQASIFRAETKHERMKQRSKINQTTSMNDYVGIMGWSVSWSVSYNYPHT